MSAPLPIPETVEIYMLLRQSGMSFNSPAVVTTNYSMGSGFFATRKEAEHHRTLEILKDEKALFHIFELTVPNPAYKGEK
jgi:hypothetical protein